MDTINVKQKLAVLALALCITASVLAVGINEQPKDVILIGWDGAQRAHVNECISRGELPNLQKLAFEGSAVNIDVKEVTDTKAGWAQILTGYSAKTTGVYSNAKYRPIPRGYTIFERLKDIFGWRNIVTIAVIGKKDNIDDDEPQLIPLEKVRMGKKGKMLMRQGEVITEGGKGYLRIPGKPYYYTKDDMDVFMNGLIKNDVVGEKALEELDKYRGKRFFLFAHFAEADTAGHKSGENSMEYTDALISNDKWLGKIVQKLKDLKIYEKTLIYVTADHGFDEGQQTHRNAPYVFLITNDPTPLSPGTRADITPTILKRYGIDLSKIQPPLDGKSLTK